MMKQLFRWMAVAALGMAGLSAGTLTQVNTRGGVAGDDFIDWGQLGADFTAVTSPFDVTSNLGLGPNLIVNGAQNFYSVQNGNHWPGNFAPSDNLLDDPQGGPFTITFAQAIAGAGMQFQSGTYGPFIASITAFGAGNVNFGTVTESGISSNAGNNSAIFLGFTSSATDIVALQVSVTIDSDTGTQVTDPNGFAVNRLDLVTGGLSIPEPSVVTMFAAGLGAIALRRRRAR
jgi:hypothetical protein